MSVEMMPGEKSLAARIRAAYDPVSCRTVDADGATLEATGDGGGLTDAVERHGVTALAAAVPRGGRLVLGDADVSLELVREDRDVVMHVAWTSGPAYEERLGVPWDGGEALGRLGALPARRPVPPAPAVSQGPSSPRPSSPAPRTDVAPADAVAALHDPARPLVVTHRGLADGRGGGDDVIGVIPAMDPGLLGSASFRAAHGTRGNLVAGAMAGGIGSTQIVVAMARAGLLGFFGAGGLPLEDVEGAVKLVTGLVDDGAPFGFNLLHNPVEPPMEERTVDLYLAHGVKRVSAAAYMRLTPAVVRYRLHDIHEEGGRIVVPNKIFAKVSRPEVAEVFLRPAPRKVVEALVEAGHLTRAQAALAARVPMAEDITAEADSGGHTDRRPLVVLLPTLQRLRDRIASEEGYSDRGFDIRIGAAGGIGDPAAAHAAFAMGADYVLTGSINQATIEAGTSQLAKMMVATAGMADFTTGPAPDMFEMGAHVQVLGQGTMYAQRAQRLYELYKRYGGLAEIPDADRAKIEKRIFRRTLEEVWADTHAYWATRDPAQVARAEADPRHQMALVFRWYLGMASRWARVGDADRRRDYQIWCGPAMGLFNDWVHGSWLDPLQARTVATVSWALLHGAAAVARVSVARSLGVALPPSANHPLPVQVDGEVQRA
jgi:trans-AT polyketide synthase, acyltransferase and oxidoreductase domains